MLYLQAERTIVVHSHIWQLVFCVKERTAQLFLMSAVLRKINFVNLIAQNAAKQLIL